MSDLNQFSNIRFALSLKVLFLICLVISGTIASAQNSSSWASVEKAGRGKILVYYHPVYPFIYQEDDSLKGIDYEIMLSFKEYVEVVHEAELDIQWISVDNFEDVLKKVGENKHGAFGTSQLSITDKRLSSVGFAPPYFPDISVLLTSPNIPVALSEKELLAKLEHMTALTVRGSTLQESILKLKSENAIDFAIEEVNNAGEIITKLEDGSNQFAYLDLPSYLYFKNNGSEVNRQLFFPSKGIGISFALPRNSDWQEPIRRWSASAKFSADRQRILKKYLGGTVMDLMGMISKSVEIGPLEEILILTKEKELQTKELYLAELQANKDRRTLTLLIFSAVILIFLVIFFTYRSSVKARNNRLLRMKQEEITQQNRSLEKLIQEKRELLELLQNEIKEANIQISSLARLYIRDHEMTKDQFKIIEHILFKSDDMASLIARIVENQQGDSQEDPLDEG